jgi:cob(I)alamin adenosyltransferase|tara:strand:- start:3960 stop:4499 length:540 start_codon:yes stop_codon:yes gene_type:complete
MRITKVTTRNGDGGKTHLAKGETVFKSDNVIHCLGEVDELSSVIGVCLSHCKDNDISNFLKKIQNNLFDIGGHISMSLDDNSIVNENMISDLDTQINHLNENLEPLKEFILPSGDHFSANLHVARAITRRAERTAVALYKDSLLKNPVVMYLNRLSDYFFVLSRYHNMENNLPETTWQR